MNANTSVSSSFSSSYLEAREKFLAACESAGASLHSFAHPLQGPGGEALHLDIATLGPADAELAIIICSGTHGPEAYCGSGVQVHLLSSPDILKQYEDIQLVFIHGHNPYGWAWTRRVNEDNIDLNRNYCDFSGAYPCNDNYSSVQDLFLPENFDDDARTAIVNWIEEHGQQKFATVALSGQRVDPNGIFYGGHEPTWSRRTIQEHLPKLLSKQKRVSLLDFHTGVGEFGQGTILHVYGDGAPRDLVYKSWFDGKVQGGMEEIDNDEIDHEGGGSFMASFDSLLPEKDTYSLVVEYGTVGIQRVLFALIADNWLHAKGDFNSDKGKEIKQETLDALYGNTPEWHAGVWQHGSWLIDKTAQGLRSL